MSTRARTVLCTLAVVLLPAAAALAQAPAAPPPPAPPPPLPEPPPPPLMPPPPPLAPPPPVTPKMELEVYGFAMTDFGYDFTTIDPLWFDVMRPSKLPAAEGMFGEDGKIFAGVRQTRFGTRAMLPTSLGELKTIFEWELFGVGVDAGQTTFRLRHAYGQIGHFGAGQTWSPFMDIDVFPNSIEYWGPNGMVFFRNVQVRYMPIMRDDLLVTVAMERPGATADLDTYEQEPALMDVTGRFPIPDFSADARYSGPWGYVEAAGIVRYINWDDDGTDAVDLSDHVIGWGANVSSNVKLGPHVLKLQAVYGRGIQNYMNDAGPDVGVVLNPGDPTRPFLGRPLPMVSALAFIDFHWTKTLASSIGYSFVWIDNTDGQPGASLHRGQYALVNLLVSPTDDVMMGGEFQWGQRLGVDDFDSNGFKLQFSFKYSFSQKIGGK